MPVDFYAAPPRYKDFAAKLMEIKNRFPHAQLISIGKSVLGRPIFALGIGNLRHSVLMVGGVHGEEWLTSTLLTRFFEHVCIAFQQKTDVCQMDISPHLSRRGLYVIPMLNPDGISIALEGAQSASSLCGKVVAMQARQPRMPWQANAHGVDLNHNFDAGYALSKELERQNGITAPCCSQYGGEYAHSEPETAALGKFCLSHTIHSAYAFHSQGEEIFYRYGKHTPPQGYLIAKLLSALSGYTLVENTGLCSHAGFKDYFIEHFHKPGFTIEIGKGQNPLPIEDLEPIYEKLLEAMVAMLLI